MVLKHLLVLDQCAANFHEKLHIFTLYSNPSVYEQSVYEFSLLWDAQINACFLIYEPVSAYTSSFLSQTDRSQCFSGSNGKLLFILRVFASWAVLEEWIKLVNQGIPVVRKKGISYLSQLEFVTHTHTHTNTGSSSIVLFNVLCFVFICLHSYRARIYIQIHIHGHV
jgi:hypothetical protein